MDRHYYCRLLLSEIPAWTWAELCFLFVVLGRSLVLHFHSAPHDVLYVGTNSLLFAWRTRFDVARKKKNDKHDRQRTAKNQTTVTTAVTPALTTVRRDKFSPVCLAHPLRCCKKKKKRQARQAAHHKKSNDRYHSCNPRPHYCTSAQILSCLPGAPASMLQGKKKRHARQAAHRKKSNNRLVPQLFPALTP